MLHEDAFENRSFFPLQNATPGLLRAMPPTAGVRHIAPFRIVSPPDVATVCFIIVLVYIFSIVLFYCSFPTKKKKCFQVSGPVRTGACASLATKPITASPAYQQHINSGPVSFQKICVFNVFMFINANVVNTQRRLHSVQLFQIAQLQGQQAVPAQALLPAQPPNGAVSFSIHCA